VRKSIQEKKKEDPQLKIKKVIINNGECKKISYLYPKLTEFVSNQLYYYSISISPTQIITCFTLNNKYRTNTLNKKVTNKNKIRIDI
jgi:hypothetical protein